MRRTPLNQFGGILPNFDCYGAIMPLCARSTVP
jgi:hypothetical protein